MDLYTKVAPKQSTSLPDSLTRPLDNFTRTTMIVAISAFLLLSSLFETRRARHRRAHHMTWHKVSRDWDDYIGTRRTPQSQRPQHPIAVSGVTADRFTSIGLN